MMSGATDYNNKLIIKVKASAMDLTAMQREEKLRGQAQGRRSMGEEHDHTHSVGWDVVYCHSPMHTERNHWSWGRSEEEKNQQKFGFQTPPVHWGEQYLYNARHHFAGAAVGVQTPET
jgi:hypothetical protein